MIDSIYVEDLDIQKILPKVGDVYFIGDGYLECEKINKTLVGVDVHINYFNLSPITLSQSYWDAKLLLINNKEYYFCLQDFQTKNDKYLGRQYEKIVFNIRKKRNSSFSTKIMKIIATKNY